MGHELHTLGMGENPVTKDHPKSFAGLLAFKRSIDVLYIRIYPWWKRDWLTLLKWLSFRKISVIWEMNAPVEEVLSHHRHTVPPRVSKWIEKELKKLRFLARFADGAVTVSETMKRYCIETIGIPNTISIANGSDPFVIKRQVISNEHPMNALCKGKFVVAWAGKNRFPWEGTGLLLEVAQRMQKSDPDVLFITFSDVSLYNTSTPANLYSFAEIRNDLLPSFLSHAHVGLCIYNDYNWSPIGFYGSSLKLFDYMAMELVVIASDMGQIAEIIKDGENGLLTDGSIEDIIRKIKYSKEHYVSLTNMRGNARRLVETTYNWEKVAEKTADFMEKIAGSHR